MKTLKKTLCLVLAVVMVVGVLILPAGADYDDADKIDPNYVEAVEVMSAVGILGGDEEANTFRPTDGLTRAEAAKIITYMMVGPDSEQLGTGACFDDVPTTHWANKYVNYLALLQIVDPENDEFHPSDKVTGYEFGKMVLVALGFDPADYTNNPAWVIHVTSDVKSVYNSFPVKAADLTSAPIHRDAAAQLAMAGLNYTTTGAATGKYRIEKTETASNYDDGLAGDEYDSRAEALLMMGQLYESATLHTDFEVVPVTTNDGSLGAKNYGLSSTPGTDAFGRNIKTWTSTEVKDADGDNVSVDITKDQAVKIYNGKVTDATVKADLKDYTVTVTESSDVEVKMDAKASSATESKNAIVKTDGDKTGTKLSSLNTKTVAEAIADLTTNSNTVEVYVDPATKSITKIVVINTYADVIADVDDAGKITLTKNTTDLNEITTKDFAVTKGQVVIFTKGNKSSSKYDVVTMKEATKVTGTMASYTSTDVFTINSADYGLASTNYQASTSDLKDTLTATGDSKLIGKEWNYYLNDHGVLVYAADPAGGQTAPTTTTLYGYLLGAEVTKSASGTWGSTTALNVSAKVLMVGTDGELHTYELTTATVDSSKQVGGESVSGDTHDEWTAAENDVVIKIGSDYYPVCKAADASKTDAEVSEAFAKILSGEDNSSMSGHELYGFYIITVDNATGKATLADANNHGNINGTTVKDAAANSSVLTSEAIAKGATKLTQKFNNNDVVIDGATQFLFVEKKADKPGESKVTVKTGVHMGADITAGNVVGVVAAKASESAPVMAKYVFVKGAYSDGTATVGGDYAYVTNVSTTSADGTVYEAYTLSGDKIYVSFESGHSTAGTAGIYAYNEDNVIATSSSKLSGSGVEEGTFTKISETSIKVRDNYYSVNNDTLVVITATGLTLADNCKVCVYQPTGSATVAVIFVIPNA